MIVYVESNFLLEIALGQEQALDAERLLDLLYERRTRLVIPAFGLSEPFSRIRQRDRDRRILFQSLNSQARDLGRSQGYHELVATLDQISRALIAIEREEMDRLLEATRRVLAIADVIPITTAMFTRSLAFQDQFSLQPEDSLILAGIVEDLRANATGDIACFVSKDAKAFFDPGITAILEALNCRFLARFSQAVDFVTRFNTTA